jgi:hypothetical protein
VVVAKGSDNVAAHRDGPAWAAKTKKNLPIVQTRQVCPNQENGAKIDWHKEINWRKKID